MSRQKKVKKGMHPAVAVGLFLVCGGIAAKQFVGMGAAPAPSTTSSDEPVSFDDEPGDASGETVAVEWQDLLAKHGSFARDSNVQLSFVVIEDAIAPVAAPAAEVATASSSTWLGDAPPSLRLGVVMLAGESRRAVLAGRVVGVGDVVADGKVTAIEPGKVVLEWRTRTLTYQLDADVPVEFRAEAARREAERKVPEGANGASPAVEEPDEADLSPTEALERVRAAAAKVAASPDAATNKQTSPKSKSNSKSKKKEEGK